MHKITFYPLGNADCCKIDLDNGRKLIFDYAHTKSSEDKNDKRIDLASTLTEELNNEKCDEIDVLGFTHADTDHVSGSSDFFYFDYAKAYQGNGRIKFKELWVPAAFIVETGLSGDAMVIQKEAKYRLEQGYGIKVFSAPDGLKDWMSDKGLTAKDRKEFIIDAGNIVPGFDLGKDQVEFFVHSPFAKLIDGKSVDRNNSSLVLNVLFEYKDWQTRFMLIGDIDYDILADIVDVTKYYNNEDRLKWDIYDIPHHCSYKGLNGEKGKDKTNPVENVKWLLEQGGTSGILVASSDVIPTNDTEQPPHRQAKAYYKDVATSIGGKFIVTMEHPNSSNPKKLEIEIDQFRARLKTILSAGGSTSIIRNPSPRAGMKDE